MHPRTRSVLVLAVVAVVVAAPVAGLVPSVAAASSATPLDAVDRPALDEWSDTEGDGSSNWPFVALDDDEEDEEYEDEEEDEDDHEREDEREQAEEDDEEDDGEADQDVERDEDDERDEEDEDETAWSWSSDDGRDGRERGPPEHADRGPPEHADRGPPEHADRGAKRDGESSADGGDEGGDSTERSASDDDGGTGAEASNDDRSGDDQQAEESTGSGQSETDEPGTSDVGSGADGPDEASGDQSVRVEVQEDDESQTDDDGEGNETGNATRNSTTEPGPDVGSANVTVLRTPEVVGQPLVVTATTTNEGTEAGRKVVQFEVEHEIVDNRTFVLQPNETKTVTFTHVFETPGNKTFEVDSGVNRFVDVQERRPSLSVSTVQVEPESIASGEDVTITAVVSNDGYANGSLPVALELFGEVVGVKNVTLATGESAEVTFTRTVHAPGTYEAAVENETAEFQVVADQANATTTDSVLESAAETPGFGHVAALVGVVVAVALALGRRE